MLHGGQLSARRRHVSLASPGSTAATQLHSASLPSTHHSTPQPPRDTANFDPTMPACPAGTRPQVGRARPSGQQYMESTGPHARSASKSQRAVFARPQNSMKPAHRFSVQRPVARLPRRSARERLAARQQTQRSRIRSLPAFILEAMALELPGRLSASRTYTIHRH